MSTDKKIHISKLREAISNNIDMANMYVSKKYVAPNSSEKNITDVKNRMKLSCKEIMETHDFYDKINKDIIEDTMELLTSDKFIPGGSIMSGIIPDSYLKNFKQNKQSCSNCYVIPIQQDSLEGIGKTITEIMRTYSYRGGCGVDITALRPSGYKVHNSAKTSSGSVSFMPLFSLATETLGQHGRRGALMITIDCRHPDIMQFIWCKADPKRVFPMDAISGETKRSIDGANISVRLTDDFMKAVEKNELWKPIYPDREANPDLYDMYWKGDYDDWKKRGGKLKEFSYYESSFYPENAGYYLGKKILLKGTHTPIYVKYLEQLKGLKKGTIIQVFYGSAKDILEDIAKASCMRGDPGVQFIDTINKLTPGVNIDLPETKILSSNPCGEQPIPAYGSCLLGAHILHKYVDNPWQPHASFRHEEFYNNCFNAVVLMNIFALKNMKMHPLAEQRMLEHDFRRIGIEFTGLNDTFSMLNLKTMDEKLKFINNVFCTKAIVELIASCYLAKSLGKIPVFQNDNHIEQFLESNYIQMLLYKHTANLSPKNREFLSLIIESLFNDNILSETSFLEGRNNIEDKLKSLIIKYGLFNTSFNTCGPTGTISILADNCSSGIEPAFALLYNRHTRVGDENLYCVGHNSMFLNHIIKHMEHFDLKEITHNEIALLGNIQFAHDFDWKDKIEIQSTVQKFTDTAISSTVNLPADTTPEQIVHILTYAHKQKLKGITVYVDETLAGVLNLIDEDKTVVEKENSDESFNEIFGKHSFKFDSVNITEPNKTKESDETSQYKIIDTNQIEHNPIMFPERNQNTVDEKIKNYIAPGAILELDEVENAKRHRVYWNGAKIYIIVTLKNNTIVEVFVKLPKEVGEDEHGIYSSQMFNTYFSQWEAITRLTSLTLRAGVPLDEVIKQLQKSTNTITDTISVLIRVLNLYLPNEDNSDLIIPKKLDAPISSTRKTPKHKRCPSCSEGILVKIQGCKTCNTCGYSNCS